jgi:formate dehydrogenase subunit gamma
MIRVRDLWTIRLHWFNACCWALLVASGFGIISGDTLRLAPAFWPGFLQDLFGGNAALVLTHALGGMVWFLAIALFVLLRWRTVVRPFLREVLSIAPRAVWDDLRFLGVTLGKLFGLMQDRQVEPQGRYNGAQRLLGTLIIFASLAIAATGLYLFLAPKLFAFGASPLFGALFRWALVLHAASVFLVLIGLVAHIYFAVVEERESLETMKSGYASVEFIHHHNPRWYEQLKREGKL